MPVFPSEPCPMCDPMPCIVDAWLAPPKPQTPDPPLHTLLWTRIVGRFLQNTAPTVETLLELPEPAPTTNPDCRVHTTLRSARSLMQTFQTLVRPILDPATVAPHHLYALREWLADGPCQTLFMHLGGFSTIGARILANAFAEPVTRRLNRVLESPVSEAPNLGFLLILEAVEEAWRTILMDEIYFKYAFFFANYHIHRLQITLNAAEPPETDLLTELNRIGSLYGTVSQYAAIYRAILNYVATCHLAASLIDTPDPRDRLRPFLRREADAFVVDPQWVHADESRVSLKAECRQWLAMLHQRNSVWLLLEAMGIELSEAWELILDVQMQVLDQCTCMDTPTVHDDETAVACLIMGNTLMLLEYFLDALLIEYPSVHLSFALPSHANHATGPYPC